MNKNYSMNTKINCELFYPRTFISCLIITCFVKIKKTKNFKILFLNKQYFSKKNIFFFKEFFLQYFNEVRVINYRRRKYYKQKTYLGFLYARSTDVNKFVRNLNFEKEKFDIKNIYDGGDDFNFVIYKIYKKIFPTFYIEHGIGQIRDSLSSISTITLNKKIIYHLSRLLFNFNISNYFPIKYKGYITVFGNRFKNKFRLNNHFINNIIINRKIFSKLLDEIKDYIKKKNRLNVNIKNSTMILVDGLEYSKNNYECRETVLKIINLLKKNELVIFKDHPKNGFGFIEQKKFRNNLIIELKKKGIKIKIIKDNFLNNLPAELIIKIFNTKKIISSFSTTPFLSKIFNDKLKCYILYDYSMKHTIYSFEDNHNRLKNVKKKFFNTFKDINFI